MEAIKASAVAITFDYPPSLTTWLDDDPDESRVWPILFAETFQQYLDHLRDDQWELVQVRVTGASQDEFDQPTAERIEVFSFDAPTLIATFSGDDLDSFLVDYDALGWHDIALNPPSERRW